MLLHATKHSALPHLAALRERVNAAIAGGVPTWLESVFKHILEELDQLLVAARAGSLDAVELARAEARARTILEVLQSMRSSAQSVA